MILMGTVCDDKDAYVHGYVDVQKNYYLKMVMATPATGEVGVLAKVIFSKTKGVGWLHNLPQKMYRISVSGIGQYIKNTILSSLNRCYKKKFTAVLITVETSG